jgi:hypothetical protein
MYSHTQKKKSYLIEFSSKLKIKQNPLDYTKQFFKTTNMHYSMNNPEH